MTGKVRIVGGIGRHSFVAWLQLISYYSAGYGMLYFYTFIIVLVVSTSAQNYYILRIYFLMHLKYLLYEVFTFFHLKIKVFYGC